MAKRSGIDGLMKPKAIKTTKTTKTTIAFDEDDEKEIIRIQDALRAKGIRVHEVTQTVRVALRLALAEKTDEEIQTICQELFERWKRGV